MTRAWILPVLLTILFWGLWAFLPKLAIRSIGVTSILIYEFVGSAVVAVVVLAHLGFRPDVEPRGIALSVASGLFAFLGVLTYLWAIRSGPVSLTAAATALYPLLTIILAAVLLSEPMSARQIAGVVLAITAMVLLAG